MALIEKKSNVFDFKHHLGSDAYLLIFQCYNLLCIFNKRIRHLCFRGHINTRTICKYTKGFLYSF